MRDNYGTGAPLDSSQPATSAKEMPEGAPPASYLRVKHNAECQPELRTHKHAHDAARTAEPAASAERQRRLRRGNSKSRVKSHVPRGMRRKMRAAHTVAAEHQQR